jgi:DNA-binding transcriptional LysR family regulator
MIWDKEARLSEVFREFSAIGSEVDLTLYVLSPDEIEHRLIDGRLHVGIACVMHKLASLNYDHLFDELNYLYCGRGHPLFNIPDSDITTADLVASQYIKKGYAVNSDLQQANTAMGKRVVGFHVEAFALLILSGRYIGFLPEHYAAIWEEKGEIRRLHPARYEATVNFSVMTAQGRPHTMAQAAFLSTLRRTSGMPSKKNAVAECAVA